MHTHSNNSHDSECPIFEMAQQAKKNKLSGFAVTDHCDVEFCDTINLDSNASTALLDIEKHQKDTNLKILKGIEIGEALWHPEIAKKIILRHDFDVVIGSVHAVQFPDFEIPYAQINFKDMGKPTVLKFLDKYFEDMLKTLEIYDFDILAHLTCPFRYINGKYNLNIDFKPYMEKIEKILKIIIKKEIALEINTSCTFTDSTWNEFMPQEEIIRLYKDFGGYLLTTGSDAHISANSALNFDKLYTLLKKLGFKNAYYYQNRNAIPYQIN